MKGPLTWLYYRGWPAYRVTTIDSGFTVHTGALNSQVSWRVPHCRQGNWCLSGTGSQGTCSVKRHPCPVMPCVHVQYKYDAPTQNNQLHNYTYTSFNWPAKSENCSSKLTSIYITYFPCPLTVISSSLSTFTAASRPWSFSIFASIFTLFFSSLRRSLLAATSSISLFLGRVT